MRAFIAIDLTEEIRNYLKEVQSRISNGKLSLAKDFHLTLQFLGEVEEEKIPQIKKTLNQIKFKKFKINLSKMGVFPSENYIRVVWVGLTPEEEVTRLQKEIDESLKEFPGDFKFHPHITLARVKFIENKKEFLDKLKNIKIKQIEFEVNEFKLKRSTLTPEGPIYEDLGIFGH